MKNLLLVMFIVLGSLGIGQAQDYNSAVGLRLGYPISASYKMFLNETAAVEGIVGFRSYGGFLGVGGYSEFRIGAAYLIHNDIESVDRLRWYYGGGAGLAIYSYDVGFAGDEGGLGLALSGYIGIEYTLDGTPVSFSADWAPTLFIGGGSRGFGAGYGALAARYVIN